MKSTQRTVELKEMKKRLKIYLGIWIQPYLKLVALDIGWLFFSDILTNLFFFA